MWEQKTKIQKFSGSHMLIIMGILFVFVGNAAAGERFFSSEKKFVFRFAVPELGLEGPYLYDMNNCGPYLGDVNNDGALDIAVSPWGKDQPHTARVERYLDVYYNRSGTFPVRPSRRLNLPSLLTCMIGDFDSDKKADIAAPVGGKFMVYPGNLDFAGDVRIEDARVKPDRWVVIPYGLSAYGRLELEDEVVNMKPGTELCDFTGGARWRRLLSMESGSEITNGVFLPADFEQWVESRIADMDGDGYSDVVIASKQVKGYESADGVFDENRIKIRIYYAPFKSMTVTPENAARYSEITMPGTEAVVPLVLNTLADMNGDDKPDIVVTSGSDTMIFFQEPAGGFKPSAPPSHVIKNSDRRVFAGDINKDKFPDLVVGRAGAGVIAVMLNRGDGTFAGDASSPDETIVLPGLHSLDIGDMNGDDKPDIVAVADEQVFVLFNTGAKAGVEPAVFAPKTEQPGRAADKPFEKLAELSDDAHLMPYYTGNIYPTPQEVSYSDDHILLEDVGVIADGDVGNPGPLAGLLIDRITRYGGKATLEKSLNAKHSAWIFLGHAAVPDVKIENIPEIPDRPEGYVIAWGKANGKPAAVLLGRDRLGLLWAVSSFNQLVHKETDGTFARKVRVHDYPVALHRGYLGDCQRDMPPLKMLLYNVTFKFNMPVYKSLAFSYLPIDHPYMSYRDISNQPAYQREFIKRFGELLTPLGIRWYAGLHPYHCPWVYKMSGAPEDLDIIMQYAEMVAAAGGNFTIMSDDSHPYPNPYDIKAFGIISRADVHMLNTIIERFGVRYPDTRIAFCPMWYFGPRGDFSLDYETIYDRYDARMRGVMAWYGESCRHYDEYLGEHLSDRVDLTWTGPNVKSAGAKKEELEVITRAWRRKPMFWQNYAGQHHLTDPVEYWPKWMDLYFLENTRGYMINGYLPLIEATAGDYCWNPDAYDPEKSIREAVGKMAGPGSFDKIRKADLAMDHFRDNYGWYIQEELYNRGKPCVAAAVEIRNLDSILKNVNAIYDELFENRPGAREWLPRERIPIGYPMFVDRTRRLYPSLKPFMGIGDQKKRARDEADYTPERDAFLESWDFDGARLDVASAGKDKRPASVLSGSNPKVNAGFSLPEESVGSGQSALLISAKMANGKKSDDALLGDIGVDASDIADIVAESDDSEKTDLEIAVKLNDKEVFRGKSPFSSKEWSVQTFEFDSGVLQATNTVAVKVLNASDNLSMKPLFLLNYAFIKLSPEK